MRPRISTDKKGTFEVLTNTSVRSGSESGIRPLSAFTRVLALLLSLSLLALMVSAFTGFRIGEALLHPNPFAGYEILWPGQPATNIEMYGRQAPEGFIRCTTSGNMLESSAAMSLFDAPVQETVCVDAPKTGVFKAMTVMMNSGRIQELSLFSSVLQEEALYLYWGAPDAIRRSDNRLLLELSWDRQTYSADASVDVTSFVVKVVTLTVKE